MISPDNHWALIAILFVSSFLSIWLEQRYRWASKVGGALITLFIAVVLVNLHVIPSSTPLFDDVMWGYAVPLAIPLLLLQTDLHAMRLRTGRLIVIFLLGAAGTTAGTLLGLGELFDIEGNYAHIHCKNNKLGTITLWRI